MRAKTATETSIELISFTALLTDIQLNHVFFFFLPSNIKKISQVGIDKDEDIKPVSKKAKTDNQL